jgi:hypothetical protein
MYSARHKAIEDFEHIYIRWLLTKICWSKVQKHLQLHFGNDLQHKPFVQRFREIGAGFASLRTPSRRHAQGLNEANVLFLFQVACTNGLKLASPVGGTDELAQYVTLIIDIFEGATNVHPKYAQHARSSGCQ